MKTVVFSSKSYDEEFLNAANGGAAHKLRFLPARLDETTASLAKGYDAVCVFVNDLVNGTVVDTLADLGVKAIALRCAGYNNVDIARARERGIAVVRVPAYSPHAVAEFAATLLFSLNRRIHKAYNRVREGNFELAGLMGFDLVGKTVTVVGTGKIGSIFARIMHCIGCRILAVDAYRNPELEALGVTYVTFHEALPQSDVISLHCPLTAETRHLVNAESLSLMKHGLLLINTGRGALIDTAAVIAALKSGILGGLALDVYEEEDKLFFSDHSHEIIPDDVFMRLTTFPNVLLTGHQAFFTKEALEQIATVTLQNLSDLESEGRSANQL
ncbi:D-lactate dehydrogenase [Roseimicrobium gellanilyticum]|uniref:D-lactate dehydrogenase n=1 Tax=Roseimicrobium gellanilyticum TaxID=748857 RepID=A0A366HUI9_9BACT|nr:2-hydroxyacid dehydrogenase [Roseimicrobium gellanilyticum]RBP47951.1 D-lactate dehydrogenase [Roseimicrobium gellanilyticum]